MIERVAALLLGVVLSPVVAILAWLVRRSDGPPSFVGLERVGRDHSTFRMWKLRTMRELGPGQDGLGSVLTAGDDRRVTPLGTLLRRWRLDELPQLWNVIRGDMGVFGPRPETPSLVEHRDRRWKAVLTARPGIAGPTQIVVEPWESHAMQTGSHEDLYRDQILPVKLAIDEWYVTHRSRRIDAAIVWSLFERFVLSREDTVVDRLVRDVVPEARRVPRYGGPRD